MAKLAGLYGMSINEAMKLNSNQVAFLMDHAQTTLETLALTNADVQKALKSGLAPATRAVRAALGEVSDSNGGAGAPPDV